mmetsp:Transcript_24603/g.37426  ORF Transcript_24603/g.37426 Transcript_24603/m.37426 type:complete len:363 (+) Transcript_24603:168-1256(+)
MCQSEEMPSKSGRADSTASSLDSMSDSDCSESSLQRKYPLRKVSSSGVSSSGSTESSGLLHGLLQVVLGAVVAVGMVGFSLWFPWFLAPEAATKTYHWAYYSYKPEISHFDNSAWTYGTDYALANVMLLSTLAVLRYSKVDFTDKLSRYSALLLMGYCVSVLAGGFCHQNYMTLESRNSPSFRILWTICVGSVTAASTFMGITGSEAIRLYKQRPDCSPLLRKVPIIHDAFWWSFGFCVTAICAWGGISFQRPACDIFIAGITQSPSTFYLMIYFALVEHSKVSIATKIIGNVGFILNAPLLPMYPLLIQYTDWTLGSVNTLLHCWLCVAWSTQGWSLGDVTRALVQEREEERASVRAGKSL